MWAENKGLYQELAKAEGECEHLRVEVEEMRGVKEELGRVKGHNLELMVQSSNGLDAIKKVIERVRRLEAEVGRVFGENGDSRDGK